MARDRKLTHEELQRDEIAEGFQEFAETIYTHRFRLLAVAVVVIVLAIALLIWNNARHQAQIALNQRFENALSQFALMESTQDAQERQGQTESLVAQLDAIIEDFSGNRLAREALFLKGQAYYENDRFEEAQEAYRQYLNQAKSTEEQARGEIALAYAYENESFFLGDQPDLQINRLEQAMTHYLRAAEIAAAEHPWLRQYAMLGQARIHELRAQNEQAREIYRQIVEESGYTEETETAALPDPDAPDAQIQILKRQIDESRRQLSLGATAQLRLERLEARAGLQPVATTVTAVGGLEPQADATPSTTTQSVEP